MTHDYKCNGTTTLFAALNVLDGKVIDRCMQRHRHQEFIRFLNGIEAAVPVGRTVHVILDNKSKSRISLWTQSRMISAGNRRRLNTDTWERTLQKPAC